ncbi:MAG: nucleoside/nucleotide kinase family protein [Microbacterium sp.]|uniref:nucleoside/nucleotide kinase family protein n=1 Tax=Microbacterium sp. TaxID=51671 RepID=UPI003F9833CC
MTTVNITEQTFAELVERARYTALRGERVVLGITGAPGAGKSTLAERLVEELGPELSVLVPMDGFHLANTVLHALGRHDRKGADDTFDGWGYVALMHRIRAQRDGAAEGREDTIYAPHFRRDLEEPIGSAIPVSVSTPLVVTEGNYLLLDQQPWPQARDVVDEVWFLAPTEDQRLAQLIRRHERFGRSPEEARERSLGSDQRNAEVITATAGRADLVVRLIE